MVGKWKFLLGFLFSGAMSVSGRVLNWNELNVFWDFLLSFFADVRMFGITWAISTYPALYILSIVLPYIWLSQKNPYQTFLCFVPDFHGRSPPPNPGQTNDLDWYHVWPGTVSEDDVLGNTSTHNLITRLFHTHSTLLTSIIVLEAFAVYNWVFGVKRFGVLQLWVFGGFCEPVFLRVQGKCRQRPASQLLWRSTSVVNETRKLIRNGQWEARIDNDKLLKKQMLAFLKEKRSAKPLRKTGSLVALSKALSDPFWLLGLENQKVTCKKLRIRDEFVFQQFPPKLFTSLLVLKTWRCVVQCEKCDGVLYI